MNTEIHGGGGHIQNGDLPQQENLSSPDGNATHTESSVTQAGHGKLEDHEIRVSDGQSREAIGENAQETQGAVHRWLSALWSTAGNVASFTSDVLAAAEEFTQQIHPDLADDEDDTVSNEARTEENTEPPQETTGTEKELDASELLHLSPFSRQDLLWNDMATALLREGFKLHEKEGSIVQGSGAQTAALEKGLLQSLSENLNKGLKWLMPGWGKGKPAEDTQALNLDERNMKQAERLVLKAAEKLGTLDAQIFKLTDKHLLDGDSTTVRIDMTKLGVQDHMTRWSAQARGAFNQSVSTLGQLTLAVAVPTATSALGAGLGARLTSILGGAYLALRAVRDYKDNVNDRATVTLIENSLKEVNALLTQVQQLLNLESYRQNLDEKLLVSSLGRREKIKRLNLEFEVVDRKLDIQQLNGSVPAQGNAQTIQASRSPSLAPTIGDGANRSQTLSGVQRLKQAFTSFFAPVVERLSRVGRFLGDALGLTEYSQHLGQARRDEKAYEKTYVHGLQLMRQRPKDSILNDDLLLRTAKRTLGMPEDPPSDHRENQDRLERLDQQIRQMRPVMHMGEHIVRLVGSSDASFGTLLVTPETQGAHPEVVNSGLPTTRAVCHYLDALAKDGPATDAGPKVEAGADGSLLLPDENRGLYHFLLGAPTATSALFSAPVGGGAAWGDATEAAGRMWIDDHAGGLPGGANRVSFQTEMRDGKAFLRLHFSHVDRDDPSLTLSRPGSALSRIRTMDVAYRDAYGGKRAQAPSDLGDDVLARRYHDACKRLGMSAEDYGTWPVEQLEHRRSELITQIAREQTLLQNEQHSILALRNDDRLQLVNRTV